ncbi:unnamed protein product [Echinostoma caproni]|uniref:HEAT repeat-containing protein 2 n=1 Tax=Echinostoma caproni TaxID=27848 RepID=A0A183BF89_9TREM|nr:unnamed protein product [Echinostoma caproni]
MSTGDTVIGVSERHFVLLSDENRFVRKKALTEIHEVLKTILDGKDSSAFPFSACASRLTNTLNDPIEVNRELAVQVNRSFLECAPDISVVLPSLFPVLVKRLGEKELVEPSEELRLECLKLFGLVMKKTVDLNPYVDDMLIILKQSLMDAFHEVKKLSCTILQDLASVKCHRFYQNSEIILNPLLSNLVHQHSKVRMATVSAIGHVLMNSQGKLVDQAVTPLTQRLFDTATTVRKSVIEVIGVWLLDLPDRYSYHTKLLPLMLSGLIDSSEEIKSLTEDYWHDIGNFMAFKTFL